MFENFESKFPHINKYFESGGRIRLINTNESIQTDPDFKDFASKVNTNHIPVIRLESNKYTWDNTNANTSLQKAFSELNLFLKDQFENASNTKKHIISIEDFLISGKFGPLKLGISRDTVVDYFGRPQFYNRPKAFGFQKASIWHYGAFEDLLLHFDLKSNCLEAIVIHDVDVMDFMEFNNFELAELFFLGKACCLNLGQIEEKLSDKNIEYNTSIIGSEKLVIMTFRSGVGMIFEFYPDEKQYYPEMMFYKSDGLSLRYKKWEF